MNGSMLDAMRSAGLAPAKAIELRGDGCIHRYRVEGDKPGSANGWYILHHAPIEVGAFGSWKTGASRSWRVACSALQTVAERLELQRQVKAMQEARATEQVAVHTAARDRAEKLWARARPATSAHPYLQRKGVHAYGIRQLRDMLLIPARDTSGKTHTLQFISPDGSKRFLTGGRIAGCYFAIGRPMDTLLLAEGYATGATVHQATGYAVAVCFSCGNLLAVARAMRDKYPDLRLVVCADDDRSTPGNPGVTHALAAAQAVGGYVAIPEFPEGQS